MKPATAGAREARLEADRARAVHHLRLDVARRVDGVLNGTTLGLRPGSGSEYDRIRAYHAGDDIRRMEWAVTARTGEAAVRASLAEHELEVTVVIDLTPSMNFGTSQRTKADLAMIVTAALAHLSRGPGSRLGGVLVTPDGPRTVPSATTTLGTERLLRTVHSTPLTDVSTGNTGTSRDVLAEALAGLARSRRRAGLVVIVTDLVGGGGPAVDPLVRPLRSLGVRDELLLVELLDRRELELPDVGHLHLVDPESGRDLHVNTSSARLRRRFEIAAARRREHRRAAVRAAGADHLLLRTDRDWLRDLARHLVLHRRTLQLKTPRGWTA